MCRKGSKVVKIRISAVCFWLVLIAALPATAQTTSPTDFVRGQVESLLGIINREAVPGTDAFVQRQEDLKAAVRQFLDFQELCRRALGDHWDQRTPEEQAQFVELMTRMVETNYTVKLGDQTVESEHEVQYLDEDIIREYARVTGAISADGETTAVEIMMIQREDSWIVYDLVTDDVSVQETYAESFDEIITDEGWSGLIQRLEDRIAELEEELQAQRRGE